MTNLDAVVLRAADPGDSDLIFDIHRQAFREYVELEDGWDEDHEYQSHLERFAHHRFRVVVADGIDVGYMATAVYQQATGRYPPGLYLHQLMILPSHQSRGIGSACLHVVAAEGRHLGMSLSFRVLRVNPRALAFYVAGGCAVVEQSDTHFSLQLRT